MRQPKRILAPTALAAAMILAAQPAVFAQEDAAEGDPSVVVTTGVLGAVVREVAGDDADVTVLMPSGADPHTWQPSARDAERIMGAALLVENGLGLEEGLLGVIEQARDEGVPVFTATDHIEVLMTEEHTDEHDHEGEEHDHAEGEEHADEHLHEGEDHAEGEEHADEHLHEGEDHADEHEHEGENHADEHEHEGEDHADEHEHEGHEHSHGPEDPHFWLDPVAMGAVVAAMAPAMADLGIDVEDRADAVITDLDALDAEIEAILAGIDDDQRKLVTGHEALGYFADRYGFETVGTVIPGDTTSGDASARDVAELIETIEREGVTVVFTDVGTPQSVAQTVADEGGAELVELSVAQIPEDGTYRTFMLEFAQSIADAFAV